MSRHRDIRNLDIEEPKMTLQGLLNKSATSQKVGLTDGPPKGAITLGNLANNTKLTNSPSRTTLASLASLSKKLDSVTLGSTPTVIPKTQLPLAASCYKGSLRDLAALAPKSTSLSSMFNLGGSKPKVQNFETLEPQISPAKKKLPEFTSSNHPLLNKPSSFALSLCSPTEELRSFPPSKLQATSDSFNLFSLILEASNASVKPSRFDTPSPDDIVRQAQSTASGVKRTSSVDQASLDMECLNLGVKAEAAPPSPLRRIDVAAEYKARSSGLTSLNLVVVGHVDAGKSTLMGHLLYQAGVVDSRTIQKFERDSEKLGKKSFAFAWVLDETADERERGVTVDVATTQFQTPRHHVTVLDAPGHRDFIPNMISGASQADVAILVVDSTPGEFESGFARGGQTKEHALLIRSLGVRQVAVAVNKLDVCDWDEGRFLAIQSELGEFLSLAGFQSNCITYVPVSGLKGDNLFTGLDPGHALRTWYEGPSLVEVVDSFDPLVRPIEGALRFPVADFFRGGIGSAGGVSVSGRILQGNVQLGDILAVLPGDETGVVKAIEANSNTSQWAVAGDSVVMTISGLDIIQLRPGSILCMPQSPVPVSNCFLAQILVFDPVVPITNGYPVILHHQSFNTSAYITSLICLLDKTTGNPIKKSPRHLPKNCTATIKITVEAPLCLEAFSSCKDLGRFALRRAGATVATGIILEVLPSA